MSDYEWHLYDTDGVTELPLPGRIAGFEYSLVANDRGVLALELANFAVVPLLARDRQIACERAAASAGFRLEQRWLIEQFGYGHTEAGAAIVRVRGIDGNDLLRRMVIPYKSETAQAKKEGPADDVMKAIVRENIGSLASDMNGDTSRDRSDYITVAPNLSAGPTISRAFAYRRVLDVLQDIADESMGLGTPLYFRMAPQPDGTWEFRTFTDVLGTDRRLPGGIAPLVISEGNRNLVGAWVEYDYADSYSYVYAGGQGEGDARMIKTARDAALIGLSPFGRIEEFVNATQSTDPATVQSAADAALRAGRPRTRFTGQLVDAPGMLYGRDYGHGDYVTAEPFVGLTFDCRLDVIHNANDVVRADLRSDT